MKTAQMRSSYGVDDIIVCDRYGAIYNRRRRNMNPYKRILAQRTNLKRIRGGIPDVMENADVFIGLSAPNLIAPDDLRKMSKAFIGSPSNSEVLCRSCPLQRI